MNSIHAEPHPIDVVGLRQLRAWQRDKIKELADTWYREDSCGYDVLADFALDGIKEIISAVRP